MERDARRDELLGNVEAVRARIARSARDPKCPPVLLPVTKTHPAEDILLLKEAGIDAIGENRVQEITAKYPALQGHFSIHLIGQLQTNKIKYIIDRVCMVQSLDRAALAEGIHARAEAAGLRMPALIEVNIGGEPQKAGITPEEVPAFARACARLSGIELRGLMTVLPISANTEALRPLFRRMRLLFEQLQDLAIAGTRVEVLSMGMSGDFEVAAQEGATLLRIGSAIFGSRGR